TDIDNDGQKEFFVHLSSHNGTTWNYKFQIYDIVTGNLKWESDINGSGWVANVDDDPQKEIIIGGKNNEGVVYKVYDGVTKTLQWSLFFENSTDWWVYFFDIDGDNISELVLWSEFENSNTIKFRDGKTGEVKKELSIVKPSNDWYVSLGDNSELSGDAHFPSLTDIDNDGQKEFFVHLSSHNGTTWNYKFQIYDIVTGNLKWESDTNGSGWVANVDDDPQKEIIIGGKNNEGVVYKVYEHYYFEGFTIPVNISTKITFGNFELDIPSNAFSEPINLSFNFSPSTVPPLEDSLKGSQIVFEINLNKKLQPQKKIKLTINYSPSQIYDLDEDKLALAFYDEVDKKWKVLSSDVDKKNKKIISELDHFSLFQVVEVQSYNFSNLNNLKYGPNPYRPLSNLNQRLIFRNLPSDCQISILTINGQLIKKIYPNSFGIAEWDGTNESGKLVASGVYIVYVKHKSESKILKIIVEK
ncbi:MAG: T9SS type A sorting domain-containing protein, partial [Thermoplasmata archaeon]